MNLRDLLLYAAVYALGALSAAAIIGYVIVGRYKLIDVDLWEILCDLLPDVELPDDDDDPSLPSGPIKPA